MLLGGIGAPVVEQVQPAQAATKTIKKVPKRQRKLLKKLRPRLTQAKSLRKLKFQQPESISICLKAAITQQAMNAWNDTKAINFKQVTDYRKANIIVNAGNYSNTGWAGITQLPAVPRGYLYGSIISLNNFFLDQVNLEIALSVAEHKLGHAIGLEHNDSQPSVMNSAVTDQRAYTIQQCDIDAVKAIYNEK